jgi:hypothetical protein
MTGSATPSRRSLVFVAGSGRSGTSVFSGLLQRLGHLVPQPEVKPDDSNPKGFAESRWVVDFHARLLKNARVQTADARPTAWTDTATISNDTVADELRAFLSDQLSKADHIVIKDPRLIWFLPLWRRVAIDLNVTPRFVTMLRHPAAVVDSKSRNYGGWQGDVSRLAGWVNTMLYTERATRDGLRAFVRYDDLLTDWPKVIHAVGEDLDLAAVREASATQIRTAESFVDPALKRSSSTWEGLVVPAPLREQADRLWELLCRLADKDVGGEDGDDVISELEVARAAYTELYQDAEAIAQASIVAATRRAQRPAAKAAPVTPPPATGLRRIYRKLPARWRRIIRAAAGRRG